PVVLPEGLQQEALVRVHDLPDFDRGDEYISVLLCAATRYQIRFGQHNDYEQLYSFDAQRFYVRLNAGTRLMI
ncbi:MAG: hypothetical protein J5485_01650, partial [Candidatus Methanomethylophilaceae archaeon]|nr:hypothetical protein [Candidatus Methanomethylophilaceae archaeon]